MSELLLTNGRIIDPANNVDAVGDVLVRDGKIVAIGDVKAAKPNPEQTIDVQGLIVAPGLIDMHVHLREPGDEEEETIASGAAAALAGGFTSIACMPNTDPAIDNEATVDFVYRQAARAKQANVFPVGAITKGRKGEELAEIGQMVRGGAVAFSDDGDGVQNPAVMLRALKYAAMFDKPLLQHCQDNALAGKGCMNAGYLATVLGLPGISPLAEELMLYRDIQLAKQAKARYHAQHVSTAGSATLVAQAKNAGLSITAEVTPHHLLLTDDNCKDYDPNYKMNPPLRTADDIAALRRAVADGVIDCLVTDHAPHLRSEKELEFLYAPCGIIGLDCAVGLYVKALIEPKVIEWPRLIAMMTVNPARILGLKKGTLTPGADADITLIDPSCRWTVDVEQFRSKSRNCPYHGWELTGRAVATIVAGDVRFELGD
ncbi:MAG: dihydroorotase [Sedimentisphaerales bacterium]|nr:dihydroorotase [Sedimentisphaerales bacterium]